MKKSNKLNLSKYKKITNKKIIGVKGEYFIVKNKDYTLNIIDFFGNEIIEDYSFELEFITKDIVLTDKNILIDISSRKSIYANKICKNCFMYELYNYKIYDHNLNKVYEIDDDYSLFKGYYYKIEDKNYNISTIKGDKMLVIDIDRYIVHRGKNKFIVDGKNNVLCKLEDEEFEIIYEFGIILRKDKNDNYIGFINQDNEIINIIFRSYTVVDDNTIIIYDYDDKHNYKIIDNKGQIKLDKEFFTLGYFRDTNLYVFSHNLENLYGVMDNNFNTVISNKYNKLSIIGENVFEVADSDSRRKLINRNELVIYSFDDSSNIIVKNMGNLVAITNNNKTMLMDIQGNIIIPFVDNNIIIMDNNRILVDNCIIDLNDEYLDLKINYELEIECLGYTINKSFSDDLTRDKFIKCINELKDRYSNELNNLLHGNGVLHTGAKQYIKKK